VGRTTHLSKRRAAFEHLAAAGRVLVTGAERGSPAERGGLHEGDIIIWIGLAAEVMSGIGDLQRVLTEERIGEGIEAVVLRGRPEDLTYRRPG